MNPSSTSYISSRILKLNVGFLLSGGPGHSNDSTIDFPTVRVSDDLTLNYVRGPLRLSRTKEGILVQAQLETAVPGECIRCLDAIEHVISLDVEELYTYQSPISTEFRIGDDCILDLAPLLRAEVIIEESHGALCQTDCKGLCPECGANLNAEACTCHLENLDPRFSILKELLDSK